MHRPSARTLFPSPVPVVAPWAEVLVPTLRGEHAPLERLDPRRGDHAVVAAHCLLLVGQPQAARAAVDLALRQEHPAAASLAWMLEGRTEPLGQAGSVLARADAWADRSRRLGERGWIRASRRAAERALDLVPWHAEARLLLACPATDPPVSSAPRWCLGGLSPERLRRRLLGGGWEQAHPDAHSLAGLLTRVLPKQPGTLHLEAACDQVLGLLRVDRPAGVAARRCWSSARRSGDAACLAVARWMLTLPPPDAVSLGPVRAAASEVLAACGIPCPPRSSRGPAQLVLPG